jgi:hypothetical protein
MGRRMSDTAMHLVENVIPEVPVRQWVLTVPYELRFRMARSPEHCSAVLRIFVRCVGNWYRRRAGKIGVRGKLKTGGVTVIQRFGSALALNVHFHTVMMDGVYRVDGSGAPRFIRVPAPSDRDVVAVASEVHPGLQGDAAWKRSAQLARGIRAGPTVRDGRGVQRSRQHGYKG